MSTKSYWTVTLPGTDHFPVGTVINVEEKGIKHDAQKPDWTYIPAGAAAAICAIDENCPPREDVTRCLMQYRAGDFQSAAMAGACLMVNWESDALALEAARQVLEYGAKKYSRDNWYKVPDAKTRYWAAAMRHIVLHDTGEIFDAESGLPHLAHALAGCLILVALGA